MAAAARPGLLVGLTTRLVVMSQYPNVHVTSVEGGSGSQNRVVGLSLGCDGDAYRPTKRASGAVALPTDGRARVQEAAQPQARVLCCCKAQAADLLNRSPLRMGRRRNASGR